MKKKTLLAALSLSLVVGLGGIAVAAPGATMTTDQPTVSEMQTYMENQDIPSTEEDKEVSPDNDQSSLLESMPMNAEDMSDIYDQMVESGMMTEEQLENMPMYTQEMPMNNQVSGQMESMPQQNMHGQGMTENHMPNAQQGHNSGGNGMMGSSGRMGR